MHNETPAKIPTNLFEEGVPFSSFKRPDSQSIIFFIFLVYYKFVTMKKIIDWISGLLKDEKGTPSSKRFVGILAGVSLCITLFANQFTEEHIAPAESLVNAVAALAFGALGLASVDKIWGKKSEE